MTDTWANTRTSFKRLKDGWREADEDTRWNAGFWATGLGLMAFAIIVQFGANGLIFCGGLIVWATATHSIKNSSSDG